MCIRDSAEAANQLIELFQPLATVTMVEEIPEEPEPSPEAQIPLEELNLSVRAYNCLKRAQVNSVSDLMGFSYEDLLEIKNFALNLQMRLLRLLSASAFLFHKAEHLFNHF